MATEIWKRRHFMGKGCSMKITIYPEVKDLAVFEDMVRRAAVADMNALATRALLLFEWAVDVAEEGQRVGAMHKGNNEWTEITLPGAYLASRSSANRGKNRIVADAGKKTLVFSYDAPKQPKKGGDRKGILLELKNECAEIIRDMMDKTGITDPTQVIGHALGMYHWALGKAQDGYTMGSLLEAKKIWTDLKPAITVAKPH